MLPTKNGEEPTPSSSEYILLCKVDCGSLIFFLILVGCFIAQANAATEGVNILPNPGFEEFVDAPLESGDKNWGNPQEKISTKSAGTVPKGWGVSSWNQEFVRERWGRAEPGYRSSGSCLLLEKMPEESTIGVVAFTTQPVAVKAESSYFFLGHYASSCEKLAIRGEWLDNAEKSLGTFEIRLPSTQDEWIHFFKEVTSPAKAEKFRLVIEKKWQKGQARFDDVSMRLGSVADYASEFKLAPLPTAPWFPIFSWMGPAVWERFGPEKAELFNRDEYHLDYALANFNVGWSPKSKIYGGHYFPQLPDQAAVDKANIKELDRDPAVWNFHGGDEPPDSRFPEIAKIADSILKRGAFKPYWTNLLPTYGFANYAEYEKHVRSFMQTVPGKFVTYDHYTLQETMGRFVFRRDFFANLEIFRRAALEYGKDWGIILQLGAWGGQPSPNENSLRWQAFNSLVYGSRAIGWFTYLTEIQYNNLNWRDNVVDWDGYRTENYTKIRRLNAAISNLGRTLVQLESTGVFHSEPLPELTKGLADSKLLTNMAGGEFVFGEFKSKTGEKYFMVTNRSLNDPATAKLVWKLTPKQLEEVSAATGLLSPAAGFNANTVTSDISLQPGEGRLFRIQ